MATLFDYLKPATLEALREKRRDVEKAEKEVERLLAKRQEVEATLRGQARTGDRVASDRAAARLLGEEPAAASFDKPATLDVVELQQALTGLERRIQSAEAGVVYCKGQLRAAASEALKEAVEPLGQAYVKAAQELLEAAALLEGAGRLALEVNGWHSPLAGLAKTFQTLTVPGFESAEASPSLAKATRALDLGPRVVSPDDVAQEAMRANFRLRPEVVRQIGCWPWEK